MIANKDRSDWFGASDTNRIMSKWTTKTFENWWMTKLGINTDTFLTKYTTAGTYWEHRILEHIGVTEMDRQIIIPELRLRVNLDGEDKESVIECKTHIAENAYEVPKEHFQQVQVQMWGSGKKGKIVAYGLEREDYNNFFRDIDNSRLETFEIQPDTAFIDKYLRRLTQLAKCLTKGIFPKEENV